MVERSQERICLRQEYDISVFATFNIFSAIVSFSRKRITSKKSSLSNMGISDVNKQIVFLYHVKTSTMREKFEQR